MPPVELLEILGNQYNPEILRAADEPRSAQDLSEELDVPIATCYRRIEELTDADLLELYDDALTDDHRRINVYRRNVEEINVEFDEQDITVSVHERAEIKNKIDDAWQVLSQG